ncbi:MAG TPA: GNAT family protein, partial [Ferruginibacter sp.]|nr:GNAT family protein [Ferruginibacter sp.]
FDQKGIHRVTEIVDAENLGSIRLMKSTGFRQEGYFTENIFFKGKWGSEFQYAMLKREWDEHKNQQA